MPIDNSNIGYTQEDLDRYRNTISRDRGLGTPTPNPSPVDQDNRGPAGLDLTGWNNKISPELQSIIDKVSSSSSSISPRQRSNLAGLAHVVGGLEQQKRTEEGQMKRLGITEAGQAERFKSTNAISQGQLAVQQGQLGVHQRELKLKEKAVPLYLQNTLSRGIGATGASGAIAENTWDYENDPRFRDLTSYFK